MTSPELAVVIPTRGRPENIRRVISAWDFTNAWDVADLVLAVDGDDPEHTGYIRLMEETRHPDTGEALFSVVTLDRWTPMVYKLDKVALNLALTGKYFALGFAGDDHLPQTIGWAATYLEELHKPGVAMVYGDDGYQGRKLSTEWAVCADVVRQLGRMVPAPVEHMYCDNSMMDLFGAAGLLRHLPQVRIEHMHPIAGKGKDDDQYRRVNSRDQFRADRDRYQGWKNGQLSADLAVLRKIRPDGRPDLVRREKRMTVGKGPFPAHFKQVPGATPLDIEITLADLAIRVPGDQEIVEIGVYKGRTSLVMAWGAQQGNHAHVTGIDPWDLPGNVYDPPFTESGTRKWADYWVQSLGYSNRIKLIQAFSHDVAAQWQTTPDLIGVGLKPVGLLFVDGDHTAEGARRDIEVWAPHLAPGATVAVDDYGHPDWPGVKEAVDALVDEGVLAPIELFHDRLAVTRLTEGDGRVTAVTGEGVSPAPVMPSTSPTVPGQVAVADDGQTVDLGAAPISVVDAEVSMDPALRVIVQEGEFVDIPAGVSVYDLTHAQAKHLARVRKIVLGTRKDKKSETLQAILDGR